MRNCDVVEAWAAGRCASTNHLTSDGVLLRSYALVIGRTLYRTLYGGHHPQQEEKVAYSYTAPFNFVSMTTSCHVGLAKQAADRVETPAGEW